MIESIELIRIGDKLIDPARIGAMVRRMLELRARGLSQQEVADQLGLDRSFISRIESLGEVRRGSRIGMVAFPVSNKDELLALAKDEGLDYTLVMTDQERWNFVRQRSGIELMDEITSIIARLNACDLVVVIGSDKRIELARALLHCELIELEIGRSPISRDVYVDPSALRQILQAVKTGRR